MMRSVGELYHPPVKRSVEIAGHKTSISLEPLFWDLLRQVARRERLPLNAIIARIDAERLEAERPPGLATAVRLWLAADIAEDRAKRG
jgi:predicted DNA-binding ribbon-helix-helix protein